MFVYGPRIQSCILNIFDTMLSFFCVFSSVRRRKILYVNFYLARVHWGEFWFEFFCVGVLASKPGSAVVSCSREGPRTPAGFRIESRNLNFLPFPQSACDARTCEGQTTQKYRFYKKELEGRDGHSEHDRIWKKNCHESGCIVVSILQYIKNEQTPIRSSTIYIAWTRQPWTWKFAHFARTRLFRECLNVPSPTCKARKRGVPYGYCCYTIPRSL